MTIANGSYPRAIRDSLLDDLRLYPVVAVMGARQVGKSTLCQEVAKTLGFARRTLDDRDVRQYAEDDPEGFLASLGNQGAFIDEVQRAPNLFLAIKAVVDREQRQGQYLLSGSNQPRVGRAVSDSLLGRAAYRTLRPLTLSELRFDDQHPGWSFLFSEDNDTVIKELERRSRSSGELNWREIATTGGFPRAIAAPTNQRLRILNDYVTVYSNRDIRELIEIESSPRFEEFFRLVAARTGQELNASGLSNDLGIPVTTIRRWIEALQRSYLLDLIPPYSRNASSRVIKAPKIFSVDPALAIAAARETELTGFHLETLVAADILVWRDNAPGRSVYHWRLASGQEVDFVLEERSELLALEVKSTSAVASSDARHLKTFRHKYGATRRGIVLSADPEIKVFDEVIACPWWAVL